MTEAQQITVKALGYVCLGTSDLFIVFEKRLEDSKSVIVFERDTNRFFKKLFFENELVYSTYYPSFEKLVFYLK